MQDVCGTKLQGCYNYNYCSFIGLWLELGYMYAKCKEALLAKNCMHLNALVYPYIATLISCSTLWKLKKLLCQGFKPELTWCASYLVKW